MAASALGSPRQILRAWTAAIAVPAAKALTAMIAFVMATSSLPQTTVG